MKWPYIAIGVLLVAVTYHAFQWWSMCNDCGPSELLNPFGRF